MGQNSAMWGRIVGGVTVLFGLTALGQAGGQGATARTPPYLKSVVATVTPARVAPGGKATLTLTITVAPGFHINAHAPDDAFAIATDFTPAPAVKKGLVLGTAVYPAPTLAKFAYSPKPQKVYQGAVQIKVPLTVPAGAAPGAARLTGTLRVQGCNATSCFPPASLPVVAPLTIGR